MIEPFAPTLEEGESSGFWFGGFDLQAFGRVKEEVQLVPLCSGW